MLTREEVAQRSREPRREKIRIPEWAMNGNPEPDVFVRALEGDEVLKVRSTIQKEGWDDEGGFQSMAEWCLLGVCDESGKRFFEDEDRLVLQALPIGTVQRCFECIYDLTGFSGSAVEDSEKNLPETPSSVSPSA